MRPIQELLNRIRWDADFGRADFEVGYYDRVADRILRVAFSEIVFNPEDHFDFEWMDNEGVTHSIPLHRIRQVFRDGVLIWERPSR